MGAICFSSLFEPGFPETFVSETGFPECFPDTRFPRNGFVRNVARPKDLRSETVFVHKNGFVRNNFLRNVWFCNGFFPEAVYRKQFKTFQNVARHFKIFQPNKGKQQWELAAEAQSLSPDQSLKPKAYNNPQRNMFQW